MTLWLCSLILCDQHAGRAWTAFRCRDALHAYYTPRIRIWREICVAGEFFNAPPPNPASASSSLHREYRLLLEDPTVRAQEGSVDAFSVPRTSSCAVGVDSRRRARYGSESMRYS